MLARILGLTRTFLPSYKAREISIFRDLYERKEKPVTHIEPPGGFGFLWNSNSFKEAVQYTFGQSSPMLMRLVGTKIVMEVELEEYEYDLPQPAILSSYRRQIVKINGEVQLAHQLSGGLNITGSDRLLGKKTQLRIDYSLLFKGMLVNGLIPLDYIHTMIEMHKASTLDTRMMNRVNDIREFLKAMNQHKILRLIGNYSGGQETSLLDTIDMYNRYKDKGLVLGNDWKTLTELHDDVSKQVTVLKTVERNKPFSYTDKENQLHLYPVSHKLTLALPKDITELAKWGNALRNCAGSYDERVMEKQTLLVGVAKEGALTYLLEVGKNQETGFAPLYDHDEQRKKVDQGEWYIKQFRQVSNTEVPPGEDRLFVESAFNIWFHGDLPAGPMFKHAEEKELVL